MYKVLHKFSATYTSNNGEYANIVFSPKDQEFVGSLLAKELEEKGIFLGDAFQIRIIKTKKTTKAVVRQIPPPSKKVMKAWRKYEKELIARWESERVKIEKDLLKLAAS